MGRPGKTRTFLLLVTLVSLLLSSCGVFVVDPNSPLKATSEAIRAAATGVSVLGDKPVPTLGPTATLGFPTEGIGGGSVETKEPASLDIFATPLPSELPFVQPDWWQVYFTFPGGEGNPIEDALIALINAAQSTIHIASFEFNLDPVADALIAAHDRGVEVQWVTDNEHGIAADEEEGHGQFARMEAAGIPVVDDDRSGLMHDKFWIFDNQIVWTGSTNITINGTTRNNNNSIVINSPDLAFIYELEFQEMFSGREFGKSSTSTVPLQHLTLNDTPIAVFFGAEDRVAEQLTRLIESAQFSIEFMAFSFTHDEMGSAMISRFEDGVDVTGIFETRGSQTAFSEMPQMFCLGIPVRQDGNPQTFHHKVIIIDNRIVVTGSFNFSENADKTNDENVIIIANEDIAFLYMQEFEARWAEATAPTEGEDVICE